MSKFAVGDAVICSTPIGAFRGRIESICKGRAFEVVFYDSRDVKILYLNETQLWAIDDPTAPDPGR
jgi:hypothetical protein